MGRADAGNFLIGFSLGAAAALLLAPQTGDKTRARVRKAAADGRNSIHDCGKAAQDAMLAAVGQGKDFITRQQRGVGEAIKRSAQVLRTH